MACTAQSALAYVKSWRVRLVRELKNLSVIVENLYQQGVFQDEEVSKIQAEKDDYDKARHILDSVTKKGEEACYRFLKIIDTTRKRTLGRLPEGNTEASTQKLNLHTWISCFSFKEDPQMDVMCFQGSRPCHEYQRKLKIKTRKISSEFWKANKRLFGGNKPDLSYTSLVLDTQESTPSKIKKYKNKKSRMSRPKKMKKYLPVDRPEISPSDLLKTNKNILLVGQPGIGKTALAHEMLKLWAERDNEDLDYMFYFDMRETLITSTMSLEDLLFVAFSEPDRGKEEVLQDIKENSDNVTIIFDGLTDLSSSVVRKLVEKDLLPYAKVIVTCRPDEEEDFLSGNFLRVEVKGFSELAIKTYLSAMLGSEQKKVLSNLELLTLCHVPMYALMVAACFSEDSPQPCTITEIYINIVRSCLQMNGNKTRNKDLNSFIASKCEQILSLAEVAFRATQGKTVNLTEQPCEDRCVLSFLKPLFIKAALTETITTHAFLHYTMQEFFAALWLLKNPDEIKDVLQQCLTEEKKHMKHVIPFMCRLLSEKSPCLMKCLIPAQELQNTSEWFFKEMINTFFPDAEDSVLDVDILFLCQCLYESQCPDACVYLLDKLDYHLDLSGESLDPNLCCAVAYVVTQSKKRKISLNLEDVMVSEQGMRRLSGCLQNVQWCDPLPQQLWEIFLLSEGQMDDIRLLGLDGTQLHLPVKGKPRLFERAVNVMQKVTTKVNVCLHWERETPVCQRLCECLLEALPSISSLSFRVTYRRPGDQDHEHRHRTLGKEEKQLLLDLCLKAAQHKAESFHSIVNTLLSLFSVNVNLNNFRLDFYQHMKNKGFSDIIPKLEPLFQSAPAVWSIDLSQRKTSILLEVLKLQSEKKQVELTGCSHEESEVRSLLQCLPYISQLSFLPQSSDRDEEIQFFVNLLCAAEREQQTGEKTLKLLASVCTYQTLPLEDKWYDFQLDLYSHDPETGLRVLPSLQSVFQSAPAVWSIDLSQRKTSILLEVLKLQSEKKRVKLTGCSHEESEVRSLLQCLPYISQLSFLPQSSDRDEEIQFFVNLLCAAEREQQTGEKTLKLLASVCTYKTLPLEDKWYDFQLDLYSHDPETGLRVLPSLQSVFQSAPAVWSIDLSQRKTSILLEVLKLQSEKKRVELTGCSHEESEVRSLLQCLPYISQLSFSRRFEGDVEFFVNLLCAAEREQQTGEKTLKLLASVCTHQTFPFDEEFMDDDLMKLQSDFLLDVFSHVKDCETKTGLRVLPSLQSVFQSAPAVWSIDLSERKTSILLEVLKLQSEKKRVKLTGCSHEESEVRSLLQCLPYISQLSFSQRFKGRVEFFVNLLCAAEREQQTGEKTLKLLASVCTHQTFPFDEEYMDDDDDDDFVKDQSDFLLDVFSHVKDCETKTGLRVLPSLQSVFQSAPAVWSIDLSERQTSILLEVLKLQSKKKRVKLTGCSHEESEVRSLLQCLPYISQLSFLPQSSDRDEEIQFFVNLLCAAEREQQTGEKTLKLLASVCTYQTLPLEDKWYDFQLDLYSHDPETGLRVLPSLQSVFQSAPAVWSIDLSQRKTSILLEVLKLQSKKKQVELTGCSHEESEVRSLLQCLPYISQLSFSRRFEGDVEFFVNLLCAAEREQQTGEKTLKLLASVCTHQTFPFYGNYQDQSDFLLDLFSHVKDCETKTGLRVLPSLQSVFQSAPAVWSIDLSQRKTSILLEVLKLQSEKKRVKLTGCSHEESEVRSLLQCLPYISQLSFSQRFKGRVEFFVNLLCAAEREQQTGEKTLKLLASVCTHQTFPFDEEYMDDDDDDDDDFVKDQSDFLLDVFSHVKDCETKTGLRVLPSLQSVFQSAPAVWFIDLSQRKTSILLEVLKLQSEKKRVKLTGCSHEESEVRSLLQCLPYISQLSFLPQSSDRDEEIQFFVNLLCAAEREQQTGEKTLKLLASVCTYKTLPLKDKWYDFQLDLYSHDPETGLRVLPSLQSVFQSAPAVWSIDLSQRKTSILLEVLKLQSEKKRVKLTGCSHEESEVRSLLQCLPYISQLSFSRWFEGDVEFFVNLLCAAEREQQTGEKTLKLLASVCTHQTFPFDDIYPFYHDHEKKLQSDFLLDVFSHVKDCETKTGLRVLPSLQSVFQSAPAVWSIDLSQRKTSILLEVLKLQSEKKRVELTGCSHEESEVRSLLQCLPYISQLSFSRRFKGDVEFFVNLLCAAEREQQTGEKTLKLLASVCTHQRFPFDGNYQDQSDFLLDVFSHVKDCETKTGLRVLPSLQSVFQSAPAVWSIDLSQRKTSILLEVLKLQSEKKQVKLTGCSHEESEVRSLLQCLPYISQLSCDPDFFQTACTSISVRSREEAEQLSSLLKLLGSNLLLTGQLSRKTCRSVGAVLRRCGSDVDLTLTPRKMSARGASLLFTRTAQLHSLRLSSDLALLLFRWVRRGRVVCPLALEELCLSPQTARASERGLSKVVSSLASVLRCWAVRQLDLTEFCVPAQDLIPLLLHDGPLTIKLSETMYQELLSLLYEIQDEVLTRSFLSKVGGDLSSCCLNWELLHHLLQQSSAQTITVNLRKNLFLQESITRLLPFLDRIVFKRPCPSFVLTAIREIFKARDSLIVPSLLRSLGHVINLTCREMDSVDCAALIFTLKHSDGVRLNLLWTSIPAGGAESILLTLDKVSQLSVDRKLLLRFVHCCAASEVQQGAAVDLLRTVQHRLDLSCSSCVELSQEGQSETLSLTAHDCRAVSTILRRSSRKTRLDLQDCEVEDSGLDLLLPVLDRVRLRASKAVLLQLVSLVPVSSERDTVRRAVSLCTALGGELDLSHTTLDQNTCAGLAQMLDFSDVLTELDLSHCELTDQLLLTLITHLHKVQVLDLSHNKISDASADMLLRLVSINPSIHTVRLFSNNIVDRKPFERQRQFEIW